MSTEKLLAHLMSVLDRHGPCLWPLLRPIANAPCVARLLPVLPRAWMGATAFELHDVDVRRGRIGIGGVDEIMWSSKFLGLYHEVLADRLGEQGKNEVLYEVGREGGRWEVEEALKHGRWVPKSLARLIRREGVVDLLRRDPGLARFFSLSTKMVFRLIINEGGWGTVDEVDFAATPIRVVHGNSQEARWVGPSDEPACHLSRGVVAGYASGILGEELHATEVECKAAGARHCVYELRLE